MKKIIIGIIFSLGVCSIGAVDFDGFIKDGTRISNKNEELLRRRDALLKSISQSKTFYGETKLVFDELQRINFFPVLRDDMISLLAVFEEVLLSPTIGEMIIRFSAKMNVWNSVRQQLDSIMKNLVAQHSLSALPTYKKMYDYMCDYDRHLQKEVLPLIIKYKDIYASMPMGRPGEKYRDFSRLYNIMQKALKATSFQSPYNDKIKKQLVVLHALESKKNIVFLREKTKLILLCIQAFSPLVESYFTHLKQYADFKDPLFARVFDPTNSSDLQSVKNNCIFLLQKLEDNNWLEGLSEATKAKLFSFESLNKMLREKKMELA